MKKVFELQEVDCANCANKMEIAISKIPGVLSARVSFITQKLTLEAEDALFEEILKKAQKEIRKIEPDCQVIIK